MPLFRFPQAVVFFVQIPKTGGTSITTMLAGGGQITLRAPGYPDWPCTPQHLHAAIYQDMKLPSFADYTFTVVRHPFGRALSEYKMVTALMRADGKPVLSVAEWFLHARQLVKQNSYAWDNHLRPQHEFLAPGIDVYRFEHGIGAIVRTVSEKLSLPLREFDLHLRPGQAEPVCVSRRSFERIAHHYRHDFALLDYDADIDRFVAASGGSVILSETDTVSMKSRRSAFAKKIRLKLRRQALGVLKD